MDLNACIFLTIGYGMMLPGAPKNFGLGEIGNKLVCYLFESRVLAIVCKNAGIIGLVKIYAVCCPLLIQPEMSDSDYFMLVVRTTTHRSIVSYLVTCAVRY